MIIRGKYHVVALDLDSTRSIAGKNRPSIARPYTHRHYLHFSALLLSSGFPILYLYLG